MTKVLILLSLLALAQINSATSSTEITLRDESASDEVMIRYYFACTRGALQGFWRGFYNQPGYLLND